MPHIDLLRLDLACEVPPISGGARIEFSGFRIHADTPRLNHHRRCPDPVEPFFPRDGFGSGSDVALDGARGTMHLGLRCPLMGNPLKGLDPKSGHRNIWPSLLVAAALGVIGLVAVAVL